VVEVDIAPAQSQELAASGAGHHRQMQVGEEVDVLGSDDVRRRRICSTDGGRMSAGSTPGGEARAAGFNQIHSQRTT
jgi:hypothetical protein